MTLVTEFLCSNHFLNKMIINHSLENEMKSMWPITTRNSSENTHHWSVALLVSC